MFTLRSIIFMTTVAILCSWRRGIIQTMNVCTRHVLYAHTFAHSYLRYNRWPQRESSTAQKPKPVASHRASAPFDSPTYFRFRMLLSLTLSPIRSRTTTANKAQNFFFYANPFFSIIHLAWFWLRMFEWRSVLCRFVWSTFIFFPVRIKITIHCTICVNNCIRSKTDDVFLDLVSIHTIDEFNSNLLLIRNGRSNDSRQTIYEPGRFSFCILLRPATRKKVTSILRDNRKSRRIENSKSYFASPHAVRS
jgi:hypothetical protein